MHCEPSLFTLKHADLITTLKLLNKPLGEKKKSILKSNV